MTASAVTCCDVSVVRGNVKIVSNADVAIEHAGWLMLVGPNGAGKTTLLHALAGLLGFSGRISVVGVDPSTATRRQMARVVALMPQTPVVPEGVSARELVQLGRFSHAPPFARESETDRTVVARTIDRLGLSGLADRQATTLSGGELQRVVLARALVQEPRVLLLDEPTSALDIGSQQAVLELVDQLRHEDGITIISAMHDLTLAGQFGKAVAIMNLGCIVATGPPSSVFTPGQLSEVYQARVEVLTRPGGPAVLPLRVTDRHTTSPTGAPQALRDE